MGLNNDHDDHESGALSARLLELALTFDGLEQQIGAGSPDEVLIAVAAMAARQIPAARSASVSTFHRNNHLTLAASDEHAVRADALQQQAGGGPCIDVLFHAALYNPHDLAHDRRWPVFGERVSRELNIYSMLSYRLTPAPLPASDKTAVPSGARTAHRATSLNVYGAAPHSFSDQAMVIGLLLATHARTAIEATHANQEIAHLDRALISGREIGTATGILMTRHNLTKDQSFNLLRVTSQQFNRKLRNVADHVTEFGELPER